MEFKLEKLVEIIVEEVVKELSQKGFLIVPKRMNKKIIHVHVKLKK